MKREKLILSAIIILTFIGSSFAFKANRINHILYTGPVSGTTCVIQAIGATTTAMGTIQVLYKTTTDPVAPCALAFTTTINDV